MRREPTDGAMPQSAMTPNAAYQRLRSLHFPLRGVVEGVFFKDNPQNKAKQTVVNLRMLDGYPPLAKVPLSYDYMTKENGEEWTPEAGALVMVQFIAGDWRLPVVTRFLAPLEQEITAVAADAPRHHRRRNGTWEIIDKNGNRRVKVAVSDFLDVVQDLTVTVLNGLTKFISKGKTLIQSEGTVEIDGIGTGAVKGMVQGDCLCVYTGKPHPHISASVKGSK